MTLQIPTEPIGSLPRPPALVSAVSRGDASDPALDPLYDEAIRDTIARFEATGSPVITDGEQRKYPEARLAVKMDPSGDLLQSFIELNNLALASEVLGAR